MKGINAIENEKDPGQDGLLPNGTSNNPNALFAQDAGAYCLPPTHHSFRKHKSDH